jgi:hypothetical protein
MATEVKIISLTQYYQSLKQELAELRKVYGVGRPDIIARRYDLSAQIKRFEKAHFNGNGEMSFVYLNHSVLVERDVETKFVVNVLAY